jgi:hypothetical protein
MKSRLYTPADYATVERWFIGHGSKVVPESILPRCGIVVEDGGEALAACWLYQDNSVGIAWLAWLVSNHTLSPQRAVKAVKTAVEAAEAVAKGLGYGLLFTMTERHGLGRLLQSEGYRPNHQGMTQFFKPLH